MATRQPPRNHTVRKKRLTARNADRHELYERAVQAPALDAAFYARWFEKYTGRPLRLLREDFCGTAVLACHHVKRHSENRAIGVISPGTRSDGRPTTTGKSWSTPRR